MEEKQTSSSKLNGFIEKNKKVLLTVLIILICGLIGYIVYSEIGQKNKENDLSAIDEISYTLTNESASLEEGELDARRFDALDNLASYTKKSGIVGARANILCAELSYQQKKYEDALNYWKAAASKSKKTYIEPIAYYNAASCYEQLGNLDDAAVNYKLAADSKEFSLQSHAKFSYGRVLETQGKYAEAVAAYEDLNASAPDDNWAKLAKTRIIALSAEGKN